MTKIKAIILYSYLSGRALINEFKNCKRLSDGDYETIGRRVKATPEEISKYGVGVPFMINSSRLDRKQ